MNDVPFERKEDSFPEIGSFHIEFYITYNQQTGLFK